MRKEFSAKRFLTSKLFLILGIVVLIFLVFALGKKFFESREIDNEINTAEADIAKLEARNSELGELLNFVSTDAFLEQEARLKFNLLKPGESVVVIQPNGQTPTGEAESRENDNFSNPRKWWNYFFGI